MTLGMRSSSDRRPLPILCHSGRSLPILAPAMLLLLLAPALMAGADGVSNSSSSSSSIRSSHSSPWLCLQNSSTLTGLSACLRGFVIPQAAAASASSAHPRKPPCAQRAAALGATPSSFRSPTPEQAEAIADVVKLMLDASWLIPPPSGQHASPSATPQESTPASGSASIPNAPGTPRSGSSGGEATDSDTLRSTSVCEALLRLPAQLSDLGLVLVTFRDGLADRAYCVLTETVLDASGRFSLGWGYFVTPAYAPAGSRTQRQRAAAAVAAAGTSSLASGEGGDMDSIGGVMKGPDRGNGDDHNDYGYDLWQRQLHKGSTSSHDDGDDGSSVGGGDKPAAVAPPLGGLPLPLPLHIACPHPLFDGYEIDTQAAYVFQSDRLSSGTCLVAQEAYASSLVVSGHHRLASHSDSCCMAGYPDSDPAHNSADFINVISYAVLYWSRQRKRSLRDLYLHADPSGPAASACSSRPSRGGRRLRLRGEPPVLQNLGAESSSSSPSSSSSSSSSSSPPSSSSSSCLPSRPPSVIFLQLHGKAPTSCVNATVFASAGLKGTCQTQQPHDTNGAGSGGTGTEEGGRGGGGGGGGYAAGSVAPCTCAASELYSRAGRGWAVQTVARALQRQFPAWSVPNPASNPCILAATRNVFGRVVNGISQDQACSRSGAEATCPAVAGKGPVWESGGQGLGIILSEVHEGDPRLSQAQEDINSHSLDSTSLQSIGHPIGLHGAIGAARPPSGSGSRILRLDTDLGSRLLPAGEVREEAHERWSVKEEENALPGADCRSWGAFVHLEQAPVAVEEAAWSGWSAALQEAVIDVLMGG